MSQLLDARASRAHLPLPSRELARLLSAPPRRSPADLGRAILEELDSPGADTEIGIGFGDGLAGILWALTEAGLTVPAEHTRSLARRVSAMTPRTAGLRTGLSGIALALDRLGEHAHAASLWRELDDLPLDDLGITMADGLPGLGLALLERAPVADTGTLLDRVQDIAGALVARLAAGEAPRAWGLLHGGAGAALFLLHVYDLTGDTALLAPMEAALRHDVDLIQRSWSPDREPSSDWPMLGPLLTGSVGVAMVVHEASTYIDPAWLSDARDRAGAALAALGHEHPASAAARLALRDMHPEAEDGGAEPTPGDTTDLWSPWAMSPRLGLVSGAAGELIARAYLTEPWRRILFFW
ncbi:lanthionine synthetase LanC family protein [Georgenia thermotolerans]|uniref:Lanthionine synthetase n=1 Tax=Georgenia thermotolerans TaxID=527326 RepID=A0A7J5UNV2_9MICO|nr:lanthionine synthetase LanC family protein [Georgenia thermotolerans]KAE8764082.1 hypothetical protein GB883_10875 [Georgenia thermotolerans]